MKIIIIPFTKKVKYILKNYFYNGVFNGKFNLDKNKVWNKFLIYSQIVHEDLRSINDETCNSIVDKKYVNIKCPKNKEGLSRYLIYWNGKIWTKSDYPFNSLNGLKGIKGETGLFGDKGFIGINGNIGLKRF